MVAEIFYFSYFEVIFHFRSSSIGGHLHLTPLYTLVKSYKLTRLLSRRVAGKSGGTPAPLSDCSTVCVWELVSRVEKVIEDAVLPSWRTCFDGRGGISVDGTGQQVCVGERIIPASLWAFTQPTRSVLLMIMNVVL